MNQYQRANTNTRRDVHVYCSSTLAVHAPSSQEFMSVHARGVTDKHALSLSGFVVGPPVPLHASIVVHLAVLCSQHVCHLKPDTYGPSILPG